MNEYQTASPTRVELHDNDLYLSRLLRRIEEELSSKEFTSASLADELSVLLLELDRHFTEEESGGYFAGIVEDAPQLLKQIEALEQQHWQFLLDVKNMQQMCYETMWGLDRSTELRNGLTRFLRQIEKHEHDERQLFQEALNIDLGASG